MSTSSEVTPNRRGVRSRGLVLDAAERVMAEHGYDGTSVARVVEESGVPISSVYHYYGSKDGILLAVMERGAGRFFADLPIPSARVGRPADHLGAIAASVIAALERHEHFLRLLIVFATQPPSNGHSQTRSAVGGVRHEALERTRTQLGLAFGDDPDDPLTQLLARLLLAAVDGAFVAHQADPELTRERILLPFARSLPTIRRTLGADGTR
jgi:AcrR family transcriptional regulator